MYCLPFQVDLNCFEDGGEQFRLSVEVVVQHEVRVVAEVVDEKSDRAEITVTAFHQVSQDRVLPSLDLPPDDDVDIGAEPNEKIRQTLK